MFISSRAMLYLSFALLISVPPQCFTHSVLPRMQPHQEPVTFENFMYGPVCNREGGISDGMRAQLPEATRDEYDSIQKVCAAALFGGHPRSNLGMVCYHNPWPNGNPIPVFRADYRDMALVQSQNGIVLEMWCQIYCSCEEVPDHLKNMPEAMPEINDLYLAEAYEQLMNDKSHLRIAEIEKANPGYKYNPKSGGSSYSVNTRSGQRVNLRYRYPSRAKAFQLPRETTTQASQCTAVRSCSSYRCVEGCHCLVTSRDPSTGLFTGTACGLWDLTVLLSDKGLGKRGDIILGAACPCNSTYVSAACCESKTGIIWEVPGLKAGEMAYETL